MRGRQRGSGLAEFALAWPAVLLIVLVAIQLAVYGVEVYAARDSALIGARVGSEAGSGTAPAESAAIRALGPSLIEASATAWCPGDAAARPRLWVCAQDRGRSLQVTVGGSVPAIVPLPVQAGLPLSADATLARETFQP